MNARDKSLPAGASLAFQEKWSRVKERLRVLVGENVFSSWFTRAELEGIDETTVKLSVPTRFLKSWIASHYTDKVLECWQSEVETITRIEVVVRSAVICERKRDPALAPATRERVCVSPSAPAIVMPKFHDMRHGSPIDPRFTLGTFVEGRTNTLAHVAVKQVAIAQTSDSVMFNPLYIHAGVGLGKTHLLQALCWAVDAAGRKALYVTAERFMYGFVSALRTQNALAFKDVLRGVDVLIIDDLQFLGGKSTQAEFDHVLNTLIDAGRQVVLAADRPPSDLESLDERIRSRLVGGLVVEIGQLDEETRVQILTRRLVSHRQQLPGLDVSHQVVLFIAKVVTSGRGLEGVVNRLVANFRITGQPITLEMAEREARDLIHPQEPPRIKIEDIQRVVARHYNVSRADLLSARRTANVVRPRQVAMYLAKTLTLRSLPEIGRRFGGRDHTTVLHAVRKIEHLVKSDNGLAEQIEGLKRELVH